ncbi:Highly reducing polyketide synthase ACTTS3 [Metarhizium brunneum]|uniref:Highly reducing polyketide synthase ACTTS3 n=1 Tax=Metarhizium brunneum TaxID=500148 RepID=A0A7D5ZAX3_9HYPO|nr:Highly reducing polyketide synthase ACTTS3 [Metarhizium brunneum]
MAQDSNGYARGEGVVVVVLKPLKQALHNGNHIEAVIRGTGVNSDGASPRLTMPTIKAQAALIRDTYKRTPAGDPVEAGAVYEAMIKDAGSSSSPSATTTPLYVGSIKTLVGHLEGGAGLGGILKALLSIKHKTIFPNLLFNELNPKVAPFYGPLQIPTSAQPWPELPPGVPMRVSVNSFGFGGTNAHAILEGFEPSDVQSLESETASVQTSVGRPSPFVLSGHSASSLLGNCKALLKYLIDNVSVSLFDLNWVLHSRRTAHRLRTFFTAQACEELIQDLERFVEQHRKATKRDESAFATDTLIQISHHVSWACSPDKLGLVALFQKSGLRLDVIVGHPSGEIAAAHASSVIGIATAMQIAYYRGKHAHLARGSSGEPGSMMAVGISYDEAKMFCQQPEYQGRIGVAAVNAPKSVTLLGDLDAIEQAKAHFDDVQVFARQLKVDTAYHSHHMEKCAAKYLESLKVYNIQVQSPREDCVWVLSVHGNTEFLKDDLESLKGPYWVANMVQPVLFAPALHFAAKLGDEFELAIEIGPHPALKGPTTQTLQNALGTYPPVHIATLQRGINDTVSVTDANAFSPVSSITPRGVNVKLLKDLPPYAWDHDRIYCRESRISKNFRKSQDSRHPLLGRRVPDDTNRELRWRNVLCLDQISWARGHVISGEVLLPGTSYISMSCEAAKVPARDNPIRPIEVLDIKIRRPVIVPDSREGVESTFTVRAEDSTNSDCISADFCFYYSDLAGAMEQSCDGKIVVYLGEARKQELPLYGGSPPGLYPIDSDAGYKSFEQNGLGYTGPFRRLEDIQRRRDYAIAMAEWSVEELGATEYTVHPALLDVSRQNVVHARADPAVGNLPTTILPVGIKRVAVSPNVALADGDTLRVKADTFVTARNGLGVVGDVHIYNASSGDTAVQMESVSLDPVSPQMPHQDHRLCFEIVFKIDPSLRLLEPPEYDLDSKSSQRTKELSADIGRLCLFYIQRILADLDRKERPTLMWYHQMLVSAWDATIKLVQEGCHPVAETSWLADKSDIVDKIFAKWGNTVDIEIVRVVGERSVEFLKRKESILEVLMKDNMAARAAERFSEFQGKTIFGTLDVESDVELQGFQKHAYDVVVASNVLHATASIKRSLEQARLLLKPGGFLLLVEITGTELMRTTFCVGGLPGWWLRAKEGRNLYPGLKTEEWRATLQQTGSSGVDLVVHDIPGQQCYSFIASQAVNDTVQQLRDPLEYIDEVSEVKSLLIVGGKTLPVFKALTTVQKMLGQPWRNRITVASDIETIDFTRLGSGVDVLGLQELDNALFSESLTDKKLKSLLKMFLVAHNILWLTHNRRTDKPACNMILLDLDSIASPSSTAHVILEAFLRLNTLSAHDFDVEPLLWPLEPELVVEGTDTLIPRVQPDQQRNDRYNAKLRIISKSVDVTDLSIGIVSQRGKLAFVECDSKHDTTARETVRVKVQLSLFIPGNGSNRGVYLLVGKKIGSDDSVVAISQSNTSVMSLSLEYVSPIEDKDCNTTFLEQIANQIIVDGLTRTAESKSSILLHNASADLTACFAAGSKVHDLQAVFSSSFTSEDRHGWITIHPQSSARAIQRLLPKDFAVFLDCSPVSASASASDSVTASILATLPSGCTVHRWGSELTISLIRQKIPRLGGVANAAMILSDKLFIDMDVDSMNATIKPKVDASKHLDSILADYPLDFFIMFSSALSVTGGHGQANYHAANMYMAALTANRKHKGRTASVMHIGHVCDVGYFICADMISKDYVSRRHMGPISEVHVHHAFAEAIIAGKPNSGQSCEVGYGIEPLDTRLDGEQEMAWSSDPRFAHFLPTVQVGKSEESQVGRGDIKERIHGAETEADVIEIVQEALVFKLESLLQLSSGSIDPDALLTKLGSDSLVAVEICAWFLKKIGIDVPVVKILGRNSVNRLCVDATKNETPNQSRDKSEQMTPLISATDKASSISRQDEDSERQHPGAEIGDEKSHPRAGTVEEEAIPAKVHPELNQDIITMERMSAAQSRIFVLGNFMKDPTAYSLMIRYDTVSELDIHRLRDALTTTMRHHDSLRTFFFARSQDNQPMQGLLLFPVRRFKHVPYATDHDIE